MNEREKEKTVRDVRRAAAKVAEARTLLDLRISDARAAGASFREIGEAAGMNHETVRTLVRTREEG